MKKYMIYVTDNDDYVINGKPKWNKINELKRDLEKQIYNLQDIYPYLRNLSDLCNTLGSVNDKSPDITLKMRSAIQGFVKNSAYAMVPCFKKLQSSYNTHGGNLYSKANQFIADYDNGYFDETYETKDARTLIATYHAAVDYNFETVYHVKIYLVDISKNIDKVLQILSNKSIYLYKDNSSIELICKDAIKAIKSIKPYCQWLKNAYKL